MPAPAHHLVLTGFALVAHALDALLADAGTVTRLGQLDEALAWLGDRRVTRLVIGVECLGGTPVATLARLRDAAPGARVLVLAGTAEPAPLAALVRAGADALVLYDSDIEQVSAALRALASGATYLDARVQIALLRHLDAAAPPSPTLTPREMEVLQRVARGLSNKAIGRELQLQEGTVKTYLRRLRQRIGARDRTHAVVHAMRIGLVDAGPAGDDSTAVLRPRGER